MKNEILAKLVNLKKRCEAEDRDPTPFEEKEAKRLLNQLDEIDSREWFEDTTFKSTYPGFDDPDVPQVGRRQNRRSGPFKDDGEFYQAVMRAGMPNGKIDHRLYQIMEHRAASGLSESVPSDGGFLVDTDMTYDLVNNFWNNNEILRRINKTTLTGNKNGLKENLIDETSRQDGYRQGSIQAYWLNEAGLKTGSKPKFRQNELTLHKLIGLCYATDELLDDAPLLAQTINEGFQAEFDFKITNSIINGTGAGQPLGILNSGCIVSVGKEAGQAADTIVYQNVQKMWSRLLPGSHQRSVFLINDSCLPQLYSMSLTIGTAGSAVFTPAGGASASPFNTLFGRPVIIVEQCPVLGDTGDIVLADFSGYRAIDKGGYAEGRKHTCSVYL